MGKLGYRDHGAGEPAIVLASGYCGDSKMYSDLVKHLRPDRRIVTLDLLGQYSSPKPKHAFGANEMLEAWIEQIDQLGIKDFVIGTYAHANWLTLDVRERLGDRVKGLVWFGWLLVKPPETFFKGLIDQQDEQIWQNTREKYFDSWSDRSPELRKLFTDYMGADDFECWNRAGREITAAWKKHGSPFERWEKINPVPTIHIYSEHQGKSFYGDSNRYLQEQIDFSRKHPLFKVGAIKETRSHMVQAEAPEKAAEVLQNFIDGLAGKSAEFIRETEAR